MARDVFGIVGRVIADAYEVEQVSSESDFATIYRAKHAGFAAPVTLKCLKLPPTLPSADREKFAERFRSEAELLFRLSAARPEIARPLHADEFVAPDGRWVPFLVLEWLDGENLEQLAARRWAEGAAPFSVEEIVFLLEPVAHALADLAALDGSAEPGLCHAELKPENLFVAKVGGRHAIKIVDFGLTKMKRLANEVTLPTLPGQSRLGLISPSYAAPEQWQPERYGSVGAWTDVWGLALSSIELLAGRRVFEGDEVAVMNAALDPRRRPAPSALGVTMSAAVEAVFVRALALDPKQRYPNTAALWDALKSAVATSSSSPQRAAVSAIPDLELPVSRMRIDSSPQLRAAAKASSASKPAVRSAPAPSATAAGELELEIERNLAGVQSGRGKSSPPHPSGPRGGSGGVGLGVDDLLDEPLDYGHALELETADSWSPPSAASGSKLLVESPVPGALGGTPLGGASSSRTPSGSMPHSRTAAGAESAAGGRGHSASEPRVPEPEPSEFEPPQTPSVRARAHDSRFSSPIPGRPGAEASLRVARPSPLRLSIPKPKTRLGRMAPGLFLLVLAIALTFFGQVYAAVTGDVLALGPISGLLLLVGALWAGYYWFRSPP